MPIYTQISKGRESTRLIERVGTYIFQAGFSVKKYGRENALSHIKELKTIANDSRLALPTRRRLFNALREQFKCQN